MARPTSCEIIDDGAALSLNFTDGSSSRYHALWLRDNADDTVNFDLDSGQRLHSIAELDLAVKVEQAWLTANSVSLKFSDGRPLQASLAFLERHDHGAASAVGIDVPQRESWRSELDADALTSDFEAVKCDDAARLGWLETIARLGVARLGGVPTRDGAVIEVAELFGYVRETNYGRLFEVRSRPKAENLAFTTLGLDPHTDNPYRDPIPTLQLLHCLENNATGGESIIVDGLAAAEALRDSSSRDFELLATWPMTFRYNGDGFSDLVAEHLLIETNRSGAVTSVRLNNRSMAAPKTVPYDLVPDFYRAYRRFVDITRDPSMQIMFAQQPGDLFIVDNTRVLHGRLDFTADGNRWLQGAYADLDGLFSSIRMLRKRGRTSL